MLPLLIVSQTTPRHARENTPTTTDVHAPTSGSVKLQEQAKFLDAMSHEIAKFRERATEADPDKVVYGPKMAEKVRAMCSDWETALAELAALAPAVAEVAAARQAAAEAKRRAQAEERRRREEAARAEEERLRSERQAAREALQLALLEGADGNAADLLAVVWGASAEEIEAELSPQLKPHAQGPRDAAALRDVAGPRCVDWNEPRPIRNDARPAPSLPRAIWRLVWFLAPRPSAPVPPARPPRPGKNGVTAAIPQAGCLTYRSSSSTSAWSGPPQPRPTAWSTSPRSQSSAAAPACRSGWRGGWWCRRSS